MFAFVNDIADFLMPRLCPSCGAILTSAEKIVCTRCWPLLTLADHKYTDGTFRRKFSGENLISGLTSFMVLEKDLPSQDILYAIKYNGCFNLARSMGKLFAQADREVFDLWSPDFILPVPLHRLKKAERGYNQAYYIARGISDVLKIKINSGVLKRIKYTESQTKMNIIERQVNMENAFCLSKPKAVTGRTVLIVDDVLTTGSTLSSCARALIEGGVTKVYAATLAIASG